jgi:hypothetical protein
MVMDKLVDAATWVKVPTEEPVFGALYAKSIEEVDPLLAYSIAVLPFGSQDTFVQDYLFSQSILSIDGRNRHGESDALLKHHVYLQVIAISSASLSSLKILRNKLLRCQLASGRMRVGSTGCFPPGDLLNWWECHRKNSLVAAKEMKKTTRALPKGTNSGKMQVLDGYYQYFTKEIMGEPVKIFPSKENHWLVIYDESNQIEPSPLFRSFGKLLPISWTPGEGPLLVRFTDRVGIQERLLVFSMR